MGRIFTTSFQFRGKTYSALVSLDLSGSDISIQVHLNDPQLHSIFPDGKLHYNAGKGSPSAEKQESEIAQELMQCIAASIESHLSDNP